MIIYLYMRCVSLFLIIDPVLNVIYNSEISECSRKFGQKMRNLGKKWQIKDFLFYSDNYPDQVNPYWFNVQS